MDKLIVVYSHDERNGTQAARIIFEKGYDNVYLLTGQVSVFAYENIDLLDGTDIPTKRELHSQHQIAVQVKPEPRNMQSSRGFTKSMGLMQSKATKGKENF